MTDQVEAPVGEEVNEEAPSLNLKDMAAMVSIIDVCSERGAFKGDDLEVVGSVRTRLVKFLKAAEAATKEEEGATATEEDGNPIPVED